MLKPLVLLMIFFLWTAGAWSAGCGFDSGGEVFLTTKRDEIALSFSLPPIKGAIEPESAKEFLDWNFRAPRIYEAALSLIEARVKAGKAQWILTDRTAPVGLNVNELQKDLKKQKVSKKNIETILLLTVGPAAFYQMKNPKSSVRFLVLPEPDDVRLFLSKMESKTTELLQETPGSGIKSSETERIIAICQEDLFSGRTVLSDEYRGLVAKIKKGPLKKMVPEFRQWIESGALMISGREKKIADAILSLRGPGVVIASKDHGAGVGEFLTKSCPSGLK